MDRLLELTSRAEHSHFWFRGFRAFVEPIVRDALRHVASPRVLDCGCGTGANLDMLGKYGDAYGFDLTWNGLQVARQMDRGPVVHASLKAIPFQDQTFDLVTSFDVLQCVPDAIERAGARELWRLVKPGGHAIVTASALEILRGRHSALSEEVRRYTPAKMSTLLKTAGFDIIRVTFLNASLFPMMLPMRLLERWTSSSDGVKPGEFDITVPPAPINGALTAMLRIEALALRVMNMPIGSSVLCLARRPPLHG
jgi:SAM-dependent methyltransferase